MLLSESIESQGKIVTAILCDGLLWWPATPHGIWSVQHQNTAPFWRLLLARGLHRMIHISPGGLEYYNH